MATRKAARRPSGPYTAVIADMVLSRDLPVAKRSRAQDQFSELVDGLNRVYASQLAAKFVITIGDEFQALLHDAEIIPQLVWTLEQRFTARRLRVGFGYGLIHTRLREYAINVDGPALDPALNGFARALHHQRATWPTRQREVVERLNAGHKGVEVAQELGISKQAVSRYASLAGWEAYVEAERGWTVLLRSIRSEAERP